MLIMCEDSYTLFMHLFVCVVCLCCLSICTYIQYSHLFCWLFALITQWTSATACLPFTETVNTCWENTEALITHLCSPLHSYKTLSEMKTISIFLYMQQHISGKGQCSSVIANIILKHYPHTSLFSFSVYCETFWRPLVTQHVSLEKESL